MLNTYIHISIVSADVGFTNIVQLVVRLVQLVVHQVPC